MTAAHQTMVLHVCRAKWWARLSPLPSPDGIPNVIRIEAGDVDLRSRPTITGSVKWDGCSNFTIGAEVMLHHCDRAGLVEFGNVLAWLHDEAGKLMPTADFR